VNVNVEDVGKTGVMVRVEDVVKNRGKRRPRKETPK